MKPVHKVVRNLSVNCGAIVDSAFVGKLSSIDSQAIRRFTKNQLLLLIV